MKYCCGKMKLQALFLDTTLVNNYLYKVNGISEKMN